LLCGEFILGERRKKDMIKQVRRSVILSPRQSPFIYQAEDGTQFDTFGEAVDYENDYNEKHLQTNANYEQVWTVQEAINKAVAENRVVRFLSDKSRNDLLREVDDLKGCKLMKPSKESKDIAVIPPSVQNFDFNDVDTKLEVK
jgi:hypothetical protein